MYDKVGPGGALDRNPCLPNVLCLTRHYFPFIKSEDVAGCCVNDCTDTKLFLSKSCMVSAVVSMMRIAKKGPTITALRWEMGKLKLIFVSENRINE